MRNAQSKSKKQLCKELDPHQLEALHELLDSDDMLGTLNSLRIMYDCAVESELINHHHHQNYRLLEAFVLRLNGVNVDC